MLIDRRCVSSRSHVARIAFQKYLHICVSMYHLCMCVCMLCALVKNVFVIF